MDFFRTELVHPKANFAFTENNLNRHANNRSDKDWLNNLKNSPDSHFSIFTGNKVIVETKGNSQVVFHVHDKLEQLGVDWTEFVYLGEDEGRHYFAGTSTLHEEAFVENESYNAVGLRALAIFKTVADSELGILAQASSLMHWHTTHQFCSRCGNKTILVECGYRRDCQSCGGQHFPRTDPAVIMLAVHENQCLLGSTARFADGMYSTLAGFVEPGETIESSVRREVLEESSIEIGRVSYLANQPWPFPANLMIGCVAEALTTKITFDPSELTDCRWFAKKEVELMAKNEHPEKLYTPPPISIAAALISYWLENA